MEKTSKTKKNNLKYACGSISNQYRCRNTFLNLAWTKISLRFFSKFMPHLKPPLFHLKLLSVKRDFKLLYSVLHPHFSWQWFDLKNFIYVILIFYTPILAKVSVTNARFFFECLELKSYVNLIFFVNSATPNAWLSPITVHSFSVEAISFDGKFCFHYLTVFNDQLISISKYFCTPYEDQIYQNDKI